MNEAPRTKAKAVSLRFWFYDFVKLTAALPGLIWLRPKWIFASPQAKKPLRGGYLAICNHIGFFDPVYLMLAIWYRRHHFVCDKLFFEGKKRWLFRRFLCIPVDRENFGMDTLRSIAGELRGGSLVSLFPEGHINDDSGRLAAFKSGMVLMALQGRAPIVPVYVRPKTRWYQRLRMVIGEPIDIVARYGTRPTLAQIDEIVALLQAGEEELKHYAERKSCTAPKRRADRAERSDPINPGKEGE